MNFRSVALGWRPILALSCLFVVSATAQTKSIKLRNETIVTVPRGFQPAAKAPAAERAVSGLFLLQCEGPMQPAWREQLRALGVELIRYVPDDAYVARWENLQLSAVQTLGFVRWVGTYRPEHKIHQAVRERTRAKAAENLSVSVLLLPQGKPAELAEARLKFSGVPRETRSRLGTVLRGAVAPGQMHALAQSPAVLWIEPAPQIKLYDEISSKIVAGDGGPGRTLAQEFGYDGSGVTVAVADSGLDSGEIDSMHPDLAGRVTGLFFYGNLVDASDEHSHGTHVAGIIGGNGATGETDESGNLFGLGVAPGVNIIAQRLFDGAGNYEAPPSYESMTRDAVRAGADIGSNSWGDDTHGRYDISAMEFDALVRDADGLALGDQPYILEFSAGNAGPGRATVGSPAVGKNVIATGASQNDRFNLPIEEFPIYDTGQDTMADFSSRGPCEDGRIKPDVVAPGTWIASLRSVYANDDYAWWPISENYMYQGGTSQAGPHVSGAAAVFVQYWRESHTNQTPSPALVKAALIHSATDMDDSIETDPVPNPDEGWGRVDLTQVIASPRRHEFVDQSEWLSTGQVSERRILVDDPEEPLKITLTYTDVPGFPGVVPALVNDLDLEVIGPDGTLYRGNQFESGESVPNAPTPDSVNNVEGVLLFAPLPGEYVVRVRARNVPQDSRFESPAVDQDFALVISGALAAPGTGIIAFDRHAYSAPALIRLTLFDQNLAGRSSASLVLRSTTESAGELITLKAQGGGGAFTAAVATATGPALANGRLEISHGDTIEAVYEDANPPGTRRFVSRADLRPPVINNVRATFQFGRTVVTWTTDEEASGLVRYGTNSLNLSVTNHFFDTFQEASLPGIVPNLSYHYIVIAEDEAGNRSTNDTADPFTTTQPPTVLLVDGYNNDFFPVPPLSGYTIPLTQLGVTYEIWDTELDGPVPVNLFSAYRCVIWRLPEFRLGATWSSTDAEAVTSYLAGGGSLLIASMEFLSRLIDDGFPNFARDVLQVQSFEPDAGVFHVTGSAAEPIGVGIDIDLNYQVYEDEFKEFLGISANASDVITVTTNGSPVLLDQALVAGVRSPRTGQDLPGRVVFLPFPLDAVPLGGTAGNNRVGLLRNILNYLAPQEGNGTIALDNNVYAVPGLVTVEVEDLDLAGQGVISVVGRSPEQPGGMLVTLNETARAGLFRGIIPLVAAPTAGPDLPVQSGDTFSVDYFDASSGQTLSVSALVETVPPIISEIAFEPGYVDALVEWTTSEPTDALVQFSDSPGDFPINFTAYDPNFDVTHALVLDRLQPSSTYYFRVVSRDRAGNVAIDDNQGQLYTFTTATPLSSPWEDNLENGEEGWTVVGADESELQWTLGVPGNGEVAPSPLNAWGSSLEGGPASIAETVLISPAIFLTGGDRIMLKFMQNYDFTFDSEEVEYGEIRLYTNLETAPITIGAAAQSSFGWEPVEIDVTAYRGQLIHVAWYYFLFSFDTKPRFGWLLDDIALSVETIVPGTIHITNNLWQARYVLAGPRNRVGQGASLLISNAPPGRYRITYADLPFYATPPPQTNVLESLGTATFVGNYTFTDANHNGMSDAWEQQYFGTVSPNRTCSTDSDGDGFPDCAEFAAGTNPTQPNSTLRLAYPIPLAGGGFRLEWPSVIGRGYLVEGSNDGSHWSPLSGWILATTSLSTFTPPPTHPGSPYLFRLQVQP